MMTEPIECPICMDVIGDKNCITTECGHKFHANCMFTNIDRNGFKCPCCRAEMIEEADEESIDDDDEDDDSYDSIEEHEPFSEDALRGLRLLTNLLEGEEQDQEDVVAEYQYNENNENYVPMLAPPRETIERQLIEQGVTYEQLVAWVLVDHDEYDGQRETLEEVSGNLWHKIRTMIINFNIANDEHEAEVVEPEEAVAEEQEAETEESTEEEDSTEDDEEDSTENDEEESAEGDDEEFAEDDEEEEHEDVDYDLLFEEGGGFFLEERDIALEDLELLRADLFENFDLEFAKQICV